MRLFQYLQANSLSDGEFADRISRTRTTVLRLRKELTLPDWDTAKAIEAATNGEVTILDFQEAAQSRGVKPGEAA